MPSQKVTSREVRRAFGPAAVDLVTEVDIRSRIAMGILRRGFWGRVKWLVFGR